jgi:hypothetical protein
MNVRIDLNEPKILEKVQNDRFGLLVSNEWKRLIQPYEPRDTNTMSSTAKLYPFKIHYIQPYSARVYYGYDLRFQKKNPYSTYEWDKAASNAGQLDKLTRTLNNALQSGQY